MPACLSNIDGSASITFFSYTTWNFRSLSKNDFRVGRHDLNFRVVKTTCNSHCFFDLLANFRVRLPLYCRKKLVYLKIYSCFLDALLELFSIGETLSLPPSKG